MPDPLIVPRAEFSIEDPWAVPAECQSVRLRCAEDGSAPRLATHVAAYHDQHFLTVVFSAVDDFVIATHRAHDDPLYDEDVVEVFLAPVVPSEYFELEVNPLGTTFDALIDSPDGHRATMRADRAWNCVGFFAAVRRELETTGLWTTEIVLRVPFASIGAKEPASGQTWKANFFRIDRHPARGDEFTAWQPTHKRPADFHVTEAFGTLEFRT